MRIGRRQKEAEAPVEARLFDLDWYAGEAGRTFADLSEAVEHYRSTGWRRQLTPHPLFDPRVVTKRPEGMTPYAAWLSDPDRWYRSPHPSWDLAAYLLTHPDAEDHELGPLGDLDLNDDTMLDLTGVGQRRWGDIRERWAALRRPPPPPADDTLVSIRLTVRDDGPTVRHTIDRVLAQTWSHWELLVKDEGSEDDTVRIVEAYARRDPRVRLVAGFDESQGDVDVYADATWEPDTLAGLVRTAVRLDLRHDRTEGRLSAVIVADKAKGVVELVESVPEAAEVVVVDLTGGRHLLARLAALLVTDDRVKRIPLHPASGLAYAADVGFSHTTGDQVVFLGELAGHTPEADEPRAEPLPVPHSRTTRRLAIVAHWDPAGQAAPHFLRQLDQLGGYVDDLVVATTATLTDEAREALRSRAELVERDNVGQDFGSWQQVILERDPASSYDELLLTNDTYVGLLRPPQQLFDAMRGKPAEVWGTHESQQVDRHLQSFFLVFTSPALRSRTFAEFWRRHTTADSRWNTILTGEIGLSQQFLQAGFEIAPYFVPDDRDRAVAADRERWLRRQQRDLDIREGRRPRQIPPTGGKLNPAILYADAALDDGRMPLVKFDTLRYDPYFLGSGRLLTLCEERYPEEFQGVREFLARTAGAYPRREGHNNGPFDLPAEVQDTIGYH